MKRERLPPERNAITRKFQLGKIKGYLTTGEYEDGRLGEIFLKIDKQGSLISGFADAWAISVSMMLQNGIPLRYIVDKFKGMRFPPEGMTGNSDMPIASSAIDYVVRWLEQRYIDPTQD